MVKKPTADETLDSVTDLLAEVGITPREQPKPPSPASPPPAAAAKVVASPVSFAAPSFAELNGIFLFGHPVPPTCLSHLIVVV